MKRRGFVLLFGVGAASFATARSLGQTRTASATLLEIPLDVQGDWGQSSPRDVGAVLYRMRTVCLASMKLRSDRQPSGLRVENHASGNPAIWLHNEPSTTAWIIVNVGARDWSKLAYQFGHELGHVLANSWDAQSAPSNPCQWLEEAIVEAFSLRGLERLADSWERRPIFPNDSAFATAIRRYRQTVLGKYEQAASDQIRNFQLDAWFREHRSSLEGNGGLSGSPEAAVLTILGELEADMRCVEDIGALNRWPGRSAVPIEQYVRLWKNSCEEIGLSGRLPGRLHDRLGLA
ncbi:MAG: hypothetical protein JO339_16090 [Alphaproteobacteria bacterium]|nr:hypothetical protein [Alphaproteobacteria bacterium]